MAISHPYPQLQHHGAVSGVTGSCHRYIADETTHLLIDCGLFQGKDDTRDTSLAEQIDFDVSLVKALIVTHVHIDHVGRLPFLLAAGFAGPILCSIPSAKLLPLVLEDALKIGFTRDKSLIRQFLNRVGQQIVPIAYDSWHPLVDTAALQLQVRLQKAGHILGSAYVELDAQYQEYSNRTVFSGDLGAPHAPLLPAPASPEKADCLVLEGTYGDKIHQSRSDRQLRLKQAIEHALRNEGTVLIPAFSIGRTQELLYELEDLVASAGPNWSKLEVIIDSPLAARFTEVYRELKSYWDAEAQEKLAAGRRPLSFENLYQVSGHEEHQQTVEYLAKTGRPAIVVAAGGMATGGRIVNYLKAMLGDPRHAVLFVGYQARGTHGRVIQQYGPSGNGWVDMDGERYHIKAEVITIGGYSAHADQQDLLNFIERMGNWPSQVRIVHGDDEAKAALRQKLSKLASSRGRELQVLIPQE